jgi:hypothetical protein
MVTSSSQSIGSISNNQISFLSWGDGYSQNGGLSYYSYDYAGNTFPNYFNGYINPNGANLKNIALTGSFSYVDISKCNTLTSFHFNSRDPFLPSSFSINFLSNTNLEMIQIISDEISGLNVNNLTKLRSLYCSGKLNNNCDFSTNTSLTSIDIRGSFSTSFPVLPPTKIEALYLGRFYNLSSKSFTYSNDPSNLKILCIFGSALTYVDISICTNLEVLSFSENNLTSLDISNQTLLQTLIVDYNNISNIETSYFPYLNYFSCSYTSISSLNLSSNTMLEQFYCSGTSLSSLNLYNNLKMKQIRAINTKITSVILATNNDIYYIDLSLSKLTTSSVNYILANIIANVAGKQGGTVYLNKQTLFVQLKTRFGRFVYIF